MLRLGTYTTEVDVEVDIRDVLSEVSDKELTEYLSERNLNFKVEDSFKVLIESAYDALLEGDSALAQLRLEQALFPKFKKLSDCLEAYKKVKA